MIYIRDEKEKSNVVLITTTAYCGFHEFGAEIQWFTDIDAISSTREDIVVGYISDTIHVCDRLGVALPVLDYPEDLTGFFGREIWIEPSLRALKESQRVGVFLKPAEGLKKISGQVIRKLSDYGNLNFDEDFPVVCSPILDIVSEWRCYIRYGEVLAIKNYRGDIFAMPKREWVEAAVEAFASAPAGYSLDVGVLRDGSCFVLEVNDGYSLGTYGINPILYAKLLSARWSQLMGVENPYF